MDTQYVLDCEADDLLPSGCCSACEGHLSHGHFQCYTPPDGYVSRRHTDGQSWVSEPDTTATAEPAEGADAPDAPESRPTLAEVLAPFSVEKAPR